MGHGTHVAAAVRLLNVFCSQGIHFSIESCADGDVALSNRRVPSVHGVHSLGLTTQTVTQKQQAPEVEEDIDFFTDPEKAISRAISKHPKVQQAEQMAVRSAQAEVMASLKANHPDYVEIIKDNSFAEWIGKSKVRKELFSRADRNYDYDAADELLSTWKERNQVCHSGYRCGIHTHRCGIHFAPKFGRNRN